MLLKYTVLHKCVHTQLFVCFLILFIIFDHIISAFSVVNLIFDGSLRKYVKQRHRVATVYIAAYIPNMFSIKRRQNKIH